MNIIESVSALLLLVATFALALHAAVDCIKERDFISGVFCTLFVAMGLATIVVIGKGVGLL